VHNESLRCCTIVISDKAFHTPVRPPVGPGKSVRVFVCLRRSSTRRVKSAASDPPRSPFGCAPRVHTSARPRKLRLLLATSGIDRFRAAAPRVCRPRSNAPQCGRGRLEDPLPGQLSAIRVPRISVPSVFCRATNRVYNAVVAFVVRVPVFAVVRPARCTGMNRI